MARDRQTDGQRATKRHYMRGFDGCMAANMSWIYSKLVASTSSLSGSSLTHHRTIDSLHRAQICMYPFICVACVLMTVNSKAIYDGSDCPRLRGAMKMTCVLSRGRAIACRSTVYNLRPSLPCQPIARCTLHDSSGFITSSMWNES